ncbi:uncharacterized protein LOC123540742 [Mercenaria mercenaria]|uniref:uncharacterized protein LOC123540742 n=1 Tax=Mercenaria mercenaria TaxID=6596 RepID=UPI00234F63E1|nr:uncharacterized protein LOC123540742 [Mercenaria mercenaria]
MGALLCLLILVNGIFCGANDLETRLKKLKSVVREQVMNTKEHKDRLAILERNVSALVLENSGIDLERLPLNSKIDPVSNQAGRQGAVTVTGDRSKRASGEVVAFHAYHGSSHPYSNHEIFTFDRVTVNQRGYTTDDGIFDVPEAGVYVFTWTVAVPASGEKIVTELVVHGSVKGILTSDPDHSLTGGSGVHPATAFVVTQVDAGDNVFIRVRNLSGGSGTVLSDDNNVRTSFSGWRLI